jgi:DNA-directed RNA polymerase subunit RPC12/RpoP
MHEASWRELTPEEQAIYRALLCPHCGSILIKRRTGRIGVLHAGDCDADDHQPGRWWENAKWEPWRRSP